MIFRDTYCDCTFKDVLSLASFPPKKANMTFMFWDSFGFWSSRTCYPCRACSVEVQNIIVQTVDNVWALSHGFCGVSKNHGGEEASNKKIVIVIIPLNMSDFILWRSLRNVDWRGHISLECLSISQNSFGHVGHRRSMQQKSVVYSPTFFQNGLMHWCMAMGKCTVGEIECIYL